MSHSCWHRGVLGLFRNQLSGTIPPEIGDMDSLTSLDLTGNQLFGSIPTEIGNLPNLTHSLALAGNQLSQVVPLPVAMVGAGATFCLMSDNHPSLCVPDTIPYQDLAEFGSICGLPLGCTEVAGADLGLQKIDSADPVVQGQTLTYTLTVTNAGIDDAADVVITDTLPEGVTLASAPACTEDTPGVLTCSLGSLSAFSSTSVEIVVSVDSETLGQITNNAAIASTTVEASPGDEMAAETTEVLQAGADLVLEKTDSADLVAQGQSLVYSITVTNNGPLEAADVVITDTLPEGVTLVSAPGCTEDPAGVLTCNISSVAANTSQSIEIEVTPDAETEGQITNNATVTSTTAETAPGDEAASETTEVVVPPNADLRLEKTASETVLIGGDSLDFELTITNDGPDDALGITLRDPLPEGITFGSVSNGAADCSEDSGTVTCTIPELAADASLTITIETAVDPGTEGQLVNQATLESASLDLNPANDSARAAVTAFGAMNVQGVAQWGVTGGPPGGQVREFYVDPLDPLVVYGVGEGLFRTRDGGANWSDLRIPDRPTSVAADPQDPDVIYAGTNFSFLKTVDGGGQWTEMTNGLPRGFTGAIAIDPQDGSVLYLSIQPNSSSDAILFKSTDGGENWVDSDPGLPSFPSVNNPRVTSLLIDPTDSRVIYATSAFRTNQGERRRVSKTTNSGESWTSVLTVESVSFAVKQFLAMVPGDTSVVYALLDGQVFKTTDGGDNWAESSSGLATFGGCRNGLAINPADPDELYVACSEGVWKTSDGAANWEAINDALPNTQNGPTSRITAIAVAPEISPAGGGASGAVYAGSEFNGVFKSSDGGQDWVQSSEGLPASVSTLALDPQNPAVLLAGTTGGEVYRSKDQGRSWNRLGDPLPASRTLARVTAVLVDPQDSMTIYAAGPGIFKTTDGGENWEAINNGLPNSPGVSALVRDELDDGALYAGVSSEGVYRSSDGGENWTAVNTDFDRVNVLLVDPDNAGTVFAGLGNQGGLFKSTNRGDTWVELTNGLPDNMQIRDIEVRDADPVVVYVSGNRDDGIFRSSDGGQNWESAVVAPGFLSGELAIDPGDPNGVFLGHFTPRREYRPGLWLPIDLGLDLPHFSNPDALLIAPTDPPLLIAGGTLGVVVLPLELPVATLGQAFAGPLGADSAVTTLTITNRVPPFFTFNPPPDVGQESCDVTVSFSRGASAGPAVRLNGEETDSIQVNIPQGGAARVVMEADNLVQGILSLTAGVPCSADSLSVSGNYLIRGADGQILEAFTIRPNTPDTWLSPVRCTAVSTFQDPTGESGLGQNLGLAVSSVTQGLAPPDGSRLDLFYFDAEGQPLGEDSFDVDGTHSPFFPLPPELQGTITTLFCLDADPDFTGFLDMTVVKVFQRGGFQFGSALFADTFDAQADSAWAGFNGVINSGHERDRDSTELGSVETAGPSEPIEVSSLGQAFAGPIGRDTAVTTLSITNRDLISCDAEVTFSQGSTLGPPVKLNDQESRAIALNIPRGGVGQVVMTAEELAIGIITITTESPCQAGSLSVSGDYQVSGPDQAIKEAFTIRPNPANSWPGGSCNAITTFLDPQGTQGLVQNLGLAVSSTRPGEPLFPGGALEKPDGGLAFGTFVEYFFIDAGGELVGRDFTQFDGTHTASFPLPADLEGLITTLFCVVSSERNSLDVTSIVLFQQDGFQFGSALIAHHLMLGPSQFEPWGPYN